MLEGIEAIVFRTVGDRLSLWESRLPPEVLRLPEELARVDALLDDPARIPLAGRVPHLTTPMKLTTRCGEAAVAGLNEALLAKAAGQKLLRTARVRPIPRRTWPTRRTRGCWPGRWGR